MCVGGGGGGGSRGGSSLDFLTDNALYVRVHLAINYLGVKLKCFFQKGELPKSSVNDSNLINRRK